MPQNSPRSLAPTVLALTLASLAPVSAFADSFTDSVTPKLSYTGESASMISGGAGNGSAYAGQVLAGADVDLEKWVGWNGATFHVGVTSRHGKPLSADELGNSTTVQEIYGGQGERLTYFTLEQKLLDDRLSIEVGRSIANVSFLGTEACAYLQNNASCGNPTFIFRTSSFTWWPVSSWSVYAKYWITPNIYFHAGAYEVNPTLAGPGKHGVDWSTDDATGVIMPYAIGYKTTADQVKLPAVYEVGGWQDTSDYRDPLYDANGGYAAISGLDYVNRQGRSGAYFRFEQQLTRPDADSDRGLSVFGSALTRTSGQVIEDNFAYLGLLQKGTFTSRPDDRIAFVVSVQDYSRKGLENLRVTRALAGGTGTPPGTQTMMELSYAIQVTPSLRIAPNLHYIINPDQFADPSRTRDLPDALIAGLRVDWAL